MKSGVFCWPTVTRVPISYPEEQNTFKKLRKNVYSLHADIAGRELLHNLRKRYS